MRSKVRGFYGSQSRKVHKSRGYCYSEREKGEKKNIFMMDTKKKILRMLSSGLVSQTVFLI